MLLNKLYTIRHLEVNPDYSIIDAEIELNQDHPVFEGHFPGNPILPGVCTVQIIKELLQKSFHKSFIMTHAGTIKYLGMVNPRTMPVLNFQLQVKTDENTALHCAARVSAQGMAVCNFKGLFRNY